MGFAAMENVLYIYRNGYQESGWEGFWVLVVIRVMLVGWMHPFFTAFTGIGLAIARMSRNTGDKISRRTSGIYRCGILHAFHNTFSGLIGGFGGFTRRDRRGLSGLCLYARFYHLDYRQ